jgi:hypothetical protein
MITGYLSLDRLGLHGIVELTGKGKSTFALSLLKYVHGVLIDSDHSFDNVYAEKIGLKGLEVLRTDNVVESLEMLIRSKKYSLIVIDTVGDILFEDLKFIKSILGDTVLLLNNQTRWNGRTITSSSAMYMRNVCDMRLHLGVSKTEYYGEIIDLEVKFNKFSPLPARPIRLVNLFGAGISKEIDFILHSGEVEKRGPFYFYKEQNIGQGLLNASKNLYL